MIKNIIIIFTLLLTSNLVAQERYLKLDSLLTKRFNEQQFSGTIIVAEGKNIVYANALGYADYGQRIPLKLSTQFDLSSGSKLFTAVAIAQLVEQDKVSFNDKLSYYFPELPFADRVTVHQLLTHSSGLGNYQSAKDFNYQNVSSCIDVLPFIKNEQLNFNPGDSVLYATSNLLMLGAIVEQVSKLTFPQYVQKFIIEPLGLSNTSFDTYFDVQDYPQRDGKYAKGYIKDSSGQIIEKNRYKERKTFVTLSSGGMWVSASDLLKFDHALFTEDYFSKELLNTMTEQYVFTGWEGTYFGYVFNIINVNTDKEGAGHAGNSSGHHSFNFHYDKRNTTLIILTNYGFVDIFELAHGQIEPILFDKKSR